MPLPLPLKSSEPISFRGCCGIGHRLSRNIPTIVYGVSRRSRLHATWNDVRWGRLFNDTDWVVEGTHQAEEYGNSAPEGWADSPLARAEVVGPMGRVTSLERYGVDSRLLFEMPLGQSVVKTLKDSLGPLVLSFLDPIRERVRNSELHLCTHVRQGNNETGDWENKQWRHIDFEAVTNATLTSMRQYAETKNASRVTVFVASDSGKTRPWFEEHVPLEWEVVRTGKELPKPESGVWFGEHYSETNAVLSQTERDERMAEAVADVFALGECDALYVPSFSSFSQVGIMLTRAERNRLFFMDVGYYDYVEYPPPGALL